MFTQTRDDVLHFAQNNAVVFGNMSTTCMISLFSLVARCGTRQLAGPHQAKRLEEFGLLMLTEGFLG